MIFIEVQSTPCRMLPYRMGRYWGNLIPQMHPEYEDKQYSPSGVKMPKTEFYTIYVGENASSVPNCIVLQEENRFLNISISVKTEYNSIGIIYEYCVCDMKTYGKDKENIIRETLRECLEKGLLREFLKERGQEVRKIMSENNEYYFEKYLDSYGNDREEKGRIEEARRAEARFKNILKEEGYSSERLNALLKKFSTT